MPALYLSLGSNLGDRHALLLRAIDLLSRQVGRLVRASSFIQTEPWGYTSPHLYLNAAVLLHTTLTPHEVLAATQAIERHLGRTTKTPAISPSSSLSSHFSSPASPSSFPSPASPSSFPTPASSSPASSSSSPASSSSPSPTSPSPASSSPASPSSSPSPTSSSSSSPASPSSFSSPASPSPETSPSTMAAVASPSGEVPLPPYSDRPIDIDILLYDDLRLSTPELTIPHPRMLQRDFVLRPLREILRSLPPGTPIPSTLPPAILSS